MSFEEKVLQKLDNIDGRFDKLEGRFDNLEGRFDNLEGRFDNLEGRFDSFQIDFSDLKSRVGGLEEREDFIIRKLLDIESGMSKLATNERVDQLENKMTIQFDQQTRLLVKLEDERHVHVARMDRIENRLDTADI